MKIAQTTDNVVTWIFFADSLPDHLPNVYEVGLSVQVGWVLRDGKFVAPQAIRDKKIAEINDSCAMAIVAGIYSEADGQRRKYDSDVVDQLNFTQAMTLAQITEQPVPYRVWKPDGSGKEWISLTYAQFCQILIDGAIVKERLLKKCSDLKERVEQAQTVLEVEAISWLEDE